MKGYIYKYTYPNGKVYIGQTVNLEKRHQQHMYAAGGKIKRQVCETAIAKYGEPKLEVLEEIVGEDSKPHTFHELLNNAERKWIELYDSTNKQKGYNIQCGGHRVNEEEFILEEIRQEQIKKQDAEIYRVRNILESIIEKVKNTKDLPNQNVQSSNPYENGKFLGDIEDFDIRKFNLDQEESELWFNYKFADFKKNETTFDELLRTLIVDNFTISWDGSLLFEDSFIAHVWKMFETFVHDFISKILHNIEENKEEFIKLYFENN